MAKLTKKNAATIKRMLAAQERYYQKWLKQWAAQIGRAALSDTKEATHGRD